MKTLFIFLLAIVAIALICAGIVTAFVNPMASLGLFMGAFISSWHVSGLINRKPVAKQRTNS